MSFQICTTCGNDFSGDDDDLECDECCIDTIQECEDETGHKQTEVVDGDTVCSHCGVIV